MDDTKIYYNEKGQPHREGAPAVIHSNGMEEWFLNGLFHRIGGPAITHEDGTQEWWVDGKLHREDGPAYQEIDGDVEWWYEGINYIKPEKFPLPLYLGYLKWKKEK